VTESLQTSTTSADGGVPQPVAAQSTAHEVALGTRARDIDRPELPVVAAFAGGFVAALVLRRLAS
jgi:hypothetical protein